MRRIFFILSVILICPSCEKGDGLTDSHKEHIPLTIEPSFSMDVKAVDGSYFGTGSYNLGLWLGRRDNSDVFVPQSTGYDNIRAGAVSTAGGSSTEFVIDWTYEIGGDVYRKLYVEKETEVSVYSYHPWVSGVTDMEAVPFSSGESDWMWAEPITLSEDETSGEKATARLTFHHAMTCIDVQLSCQYDGTVILTGITLKDSKGRIYTKGTLNALNGELTLDDSDMTGELFIKKYKSLQQTPITFSLIFPEINDLSLDDGRGNGELRLAFEFNNKVGRQEFYLPAVMSKDGEDVTVDSFGRGLKYTYELVLDNKVRFSPVGIEEDWGNQSIDIIL